MRIMLAAAAVVVLATLAPAQDGAKAAGPPLPAEYQKLVADFAAENASLKAAVKKLTESEEYKKAVEAKDREAVDKLRAGLPKVDRKAFGDRALAAAEKAKGDDRARFLLWAIENGASPEATNKAVDALITDHVKSPLMLDFVSSSNFVYGLARLDAAKASERFTKIREGTDNPLVKAWTLYAEGIGLTRSKESDEDDKARGAELVAQAEKLAAGTDLADRIAGPRFEKERLQIGMEAPDIAGEDLDGVKFKLSDYRGKVVVIDFWGDW